MKLIINIQKKYATYILTLFAVLAIEIAANYASAVPLQWHPLSEFSFDDDGDFVITTPSGDFNSTYLDGPISVSTGGNVGIGVAPSDKRLTVSGNISLISAGSGIVFPDGTFMNSCLSDLDGDGYVNDKCNGIIVNDYCDNNVTAWLAPNTDADSDGHASANACPGGAKPTDDYCDSDAAAWFPQNKDVDGDGHSPFNTCPGGVKPIDDYCDGTAGVWLAINTDSDVDGHSPTVTCPGGAKPRDDCNDGCATCYPGSTAYTCAADGLDQDCINGADDWVYGAWTGIGGSCGAIGQSCGDWITANNLASGCVVQQAVKCTDTWAGTCNFDWGYGVGVGACVYEGNFVGGYAQNYGSYWWNWPTFRPTRCQPYNDQPPCGGVCSGYGYTYVRFAGVR